MASPIPHQPAPRTSLAVPASRVSFFPRDWSDTDQQIFETLVLPAASSSSLEAASTSRPRSAIIPRRTRRLKTHVSIEEKRRKHREVQRRFMQRQTARRTHVQQSILALEQHVAVLRLSNEQEALARENRTLQRRAETLLDTPPLGPTFEALDRMFATEVEAVERAFQPFTVQQWQAIVGQTLHCVDGICTQEALVGEASGRYVMGWLDRRHVENTSVKFTLHKTFPHVCAETLWTSTWERLSTDSYASFFSPSLIIRKHLLQKVGNDAIIIYRVICYPQTGRVARAIEVISRVRRDHDFVYFARTLDLPDVKARVCATDVWTQSLMVLRFMPSDPTCPRVGCVVQYGGYFVNVPKGGTKYWLMEVLFLVLRFESSLISPLFSLCN